MNRPMKTKISLLLLLFMRCTSPSSEAIALTWINNANTAHGTSLLDETAFSFQFREYKYTYEKTKGKKVYSRTRITAEGIMSDRLENDRLFSRRLDGVPVAVPDSLQLVYTESLNSVFYFMQLPKVLKDRAVMPTYLGKVKIKGEPYVVLKVRFQQEGGGVDFQDEYRYWIHEHTHLIDYLAYRYHTNGGGTRFRALKHRERHAGFVVQDYDNYKAKEKHPPLDDLPARYESESLTLVSVIENKDFQLLD